jgi:UDP-glucose 4-epimerase
MKFVAGESFIVNSEKSNVKLSTAIYGNVLNSTGSIIPLIWDAIKNNYELTLYSDEMTRFMIDIDDAMNLIEYSVGFSGYNVIPNLESFKVLDIFNIYREKFGLKYNLGKPRISEKIHEMMISKEEVSRTKYDKEKNIYLMNYKETYGNKFKWDEFTSDFTVISYDKLKNKLQNNNFYKP